MPALNSIDEPIGIAFELLRVVKGRVILGIAGPPGSGKSTLASLIVDTVNRHLGTNTAVGLPMDGFHRHNDDLRAMGLYNVKGAPQTFDRDAYLDTLRRASVDRAAVSAPGYDHALHNPQPNMHEIFPETRLVVTEGNYLLLPDWQEVRQMCAEVWFLRADIGVLKGRLLERQLTGIRKDDPDAAIRHVESSDLPNAALTNSFTDHADRIFEFVDGALQADRGMRR